MPKLAEYLSQRQDNAAAYVMNARALMLLNRNAAKEDLKRAISLAPDNALSHALLADILWREKQTNQAAEETIRALTLQRDNPIAQLVRLQILAEMHRWTAVAGLANEVLLVLPDNSEVIRLVGLALNVVGRFSDAMLFAERFLKPDLRAQYSPAAQSAALALRAAARFGLKDYEAAIHDADEAIGLTRAQQISFFGPCDAAHFAKVQSLEALQRWDEVVLAGKAAYRSLKPDTNESAQVIAIMKWAHKNRQAVKTTGPA